MGWKARSVLRTLGCFADADGRKDWQQTRRGTGRGFDSPRGVAKVANTFAEVYVLENGRFRLAMAAEAWAA